MNLFDKLESRFPNFYDCFSLITRKGKFYFIPKDDAPILCLRSFREYLDKIEMPYKRLIFQ